MKTLTNSGDFTVSRIRISISGGTQRELETSIQPLKKPTANHLPVILKIEPKPASSPRNNLQSHRRLPECRNKQFEESFSKDLQN
jgi:hypothetical protein